MGKCVMVLKHAFGSHLTLFILDTGTQVLRQLLKNKMIRRHFINICTVCGDKGIFRDINTS